MSGFAERLQPAQAGDELIYNEHYIRYEAAAALVAATTPADGLVVDCACGEGYGSARLAQLGRQTIGLDIDASAVKVAAERYVSDNLSFRQDSAETLDTVADHTVDAFISFETIEHLPNYQKYLANVARVLKPQGWAIISTPNRQIFLNKNPYHVHEFELAEFHEELKRQFSQVAVYQQHNGLASWLAGQGTMTASVSSTGRPRYFVALVGQGVLPQLPGVAGLNGAAYERRENNPAWRIINRLYAVARKFW